MDACIETLRANGCVAPICDRWSSSGRSDGFWAPPRGGARGDRHLRLGDPSRRRGRPSRHPRQGVIVRAGQPAVEPAQGQGLPVREPVLAKREVVKAGYDEAILLDTTGQVAEASGENIFAVLRGRLRRRRCRAILDGITRDSVLTWRTIWASRPTSAR